MRDRISPMLKFRRLIALVSTGASIHKSAKKIVKKLLTFATQSITVYSRPVDPGLAGFGLIFCRLCVGNLLSMTTAAGVIFNVRHGDSMIRFCIVAIRFD